MASDLPLFIDAFLLFHSDKPAYQALHEGILKYLRFLRDKAASGHLNPQLVASWYKFKEVKQNWFGFTVLGNGGHGLGDDFARALHESLGTVLRTSNKMNARNTVYRTDPGAMGGRRNQASGF